MGERHARVMPVHRPESGLEAKFSLEAIVAAGLISGKVGFAEISDAFVNRSDVQALIEKVEIEVGPDDDPVYPSGGRADVVRLDLADGRTLESAEVTRWRGHAERPMDDAELREKFMDCATLTISEPAAERLFAQFGDIESIESIDEVAVLETP